MKGSPSDGFVLTVVHLLQHLGPVKIPPSFEVAHSVQFVVGFFFLLFFFKKKGVHMKEKREGEIIRREGWWMRKCVRRE